MFKVQVFAVSFYYQLGGLGNDHMYKNERNTQHNKTLLHSDKFTLQRCGFFACGREDIKNGKHDSWRGRSDFFALLFVLLLISLYLINKKSRSARQPPALVFVDRSHEKTIIVPSRLRRDGIFLYLLIVK